MENVFVMGFFQPHGAKVVKYKNMEGFLQNGRKEVKIFHSGS